MPSGERNKGLCEHQLHIQLSHLAKEKKKKKKTEFKEPENFEALSIDRARDE